MVPLLEVINSVIPISDTVLITAITAIVSLIGTIFSAVMAYFVARLNSKANRASETRHDIKDKLHTQTILTEQRLAELKDLSTQTVKTAGEVKEMVNGGMKNQLKISADALRRVSELEPTPENIAAAKIAAKLYLEH